MKIVIYTDLFICLQGNEKKQLGWQLFFIRLVRQMTKRRSKSKLFFVLSLNTYITTTKIKQKNSMRKNGVKEVPPFLYILNNNTLSISYYVLF